MDRAGNVGNLTVSGFDLLTNHIWLAGYGASSGAVVLQPSGVVSLQQSVAKHARTRPKPSIGMSSHDELGL